MNKVGPKIIILVFSDWVRFKNFLFVRSVTINDYKRVSSYHKPCLVWLYLPFQRKYTTSIYDEV